MEDNLKIILDEFDQYKGQFIITVNNTVERLVAIGDDNEDWYYITWKKNKLYWWSCVGRIIPLKGFIDNDGYNYLVHIAKLNDYDKIFDYDEFKIYLDSYLKEFPNDNFITDFCWELTEI
ncbi:MAG: hypothetical protein JXA99_02030 [Candidatus Lokiarchaeota archaeon]|nr:hypothetical protein [Candidatus Lokiarchaeota archaeon]